MIHGHVAPGFESIAAAFELGHSDDPGGAQLCVYQGGSVVVDLWAGSDPATGVPIDGDSLFVLWSVTKGMVAIIVASLIQEGRLDPDEPVSSVWPEFGVRGKEQTTIAHFLTHAAGLPFFPSGAGITSRDLPNWALCTEVLANAEPLWAPGTASWYHPFTFGYLNGEVLRRSTGTTLSELFAERIAGPLGVDFWIGGLPAARETDVTNRRPLNPPPPTPPSELWARHGVDLSDPAIQELLEQVQSIPDMAEFLNTPEAHQMEFGGAGGIASARSVAKVYAATIGEVDAVRLLAPETLDVVTRPRTLDLGPIPHLAAVPDQKIAEFGLGFWLGSQKFPSDRFGSGGTFGHPGAGGNRAFAHPESGMAVAYTCTGMWSDDSRPDPRVSWAEPLADLAGA
jgi:CubicO group peptidase (beta-lactamase class C family)